MGIEPGKRGFNRNSLIIMALGNIIGSGIFLGSGSVISLAGPAAVLAYAIGGFIMTLEVMFITEMCVINPVHGAFRVHASEIFGPWIGFVNGWMFWCCGVLGMASEVAAAAIFTKLWFTQIPLWVFCVLYSVIMTVINLSDAKGLGRIQGFLASVKVLALVAFVIFGFLTVTGIITIGDLRPVPAFNSLSNFMPKGVSGIFAAMIMVMFSYTGTGIIGLAIADTHDPAKNAPAAIKTITITVTLLYCLSILFVVLLTPWSSVPVDSSPFVGIIQRIGIGSGANILNFIVLTAALSGLNSSMYSASRMLYSLSRDRQASKKFAITNKNGVPIYALGLNCIVLTITALISYILPTKVFIIFATASGFTAMFNWLTISITHYFYRKKTMRTSPEKVKYKVPFHPYSSFLAIFLILMVFVTSPLYPGQVTGLIGSVMLFIVLVLLYFIVSAMGKMHF